MAKSEQLKILLVEDSLATAKLVEATMAAHLSVSARHIHAKNLAEGIKLASEKPDLMVLDLNLPDSMGLTTLERLNTSAKDIPIVVLSNESSEETILTAIKKGAQDYIVKGRDFGAALARAVRFALERKERLRLESELLAARKLQESLLPEQPPDLDGFEIAGVNVPSVETSGDYFDYMTQLAAMEGDIVGVVIGDVSGHGFGPAVVSAETRAFLHALALTEGDLGELLHKANRLLYEAHPDYFVTLFFVCLHPRARSFFYAGAGHESYLLTAAGAQRTLQSTGMPLGLIENMQLSCSKPITMQKGDLLLLVTDGVHEAESEEKERYGQGRLFEFLLANRQNSATEIVQGLCRSICEFTKERVQDDDLTVVLVKAV